MFTWLRSNRPKTSQRQTRTVVRRALPRLEGLEERAVPTTVSNHHGGVLPRVEVQALYLGSDWSSPTYSQQAAQLDGFLKSVVNSPYMDMLANAGYGVGRGSFNSGCFANVDLYKTVPLDDGSIRQILQAHIDNRTLQPNDANRLYVIYVEDNVTVQVGNVNSKNTFLGYHSFYTGVDAFGQPETVKYAVMAYPGGSVGNLSRSWLSTFNNLTVTTSHELAEAVTDPFLNGWNGGSADTEIGDLADGSVVYLSNFVAGGPDKYAVQRIADQNAQPMTPRSAIGSARGDFVLDALGNLFKDYYPGPSLGHSPVFLDSGIARISDQGIDVWGNNMIDVVTTNGNAYEYHDISNGWISLGSGVKDAKADQGVSYVLYTNGTLAEYQEASNSWSTIWGSNVASIDAGTDRYGVNEVAVVFTNGSAYLHSDSTGWHFLNSGVKAVSVGQQGVAALFYLNGNAYSYKESSGVFTYLTTQVSKLSAGTDEYGNAEFELLFASGAEYEYRSGTGWSKLVSGATAVSKAHNGLVELLVAGTAYEHDPSGWHYLASNAAAVA